MKTFIAQNSIILFGVFWLLSGMAHAQPEKPEIVHPRSVVAKAQLPELQKRAQQPGFAPFFERLKANARHFGNLKPRDDEFRSSLDDAALLFSQMYALTGDKDYAQKAYRKIHRVIEKSKPYNDPFAKGLTRAAITKNMALTYDLCYNAWNEEQREHVNQQLAWAVKTIQASMGYQANYELISNWMGVRYATVILASVVYDHNGEGRSPVKPYFWDALKRLRDHIQANVNKNGWNAESSGYHAYNWSFISHALVALQKHYAFEKFELPNYAPHAINSLWGISTATVSIGGVHGKGMKPDLSDDNALISDEIFVQAMPLYPKTQWPAIKWMKQYLRVEEQYMDRNTLDFFRIAYANPEVEPLNPELQGWRHYMDKEQGLVLMRNRFQDENDIVAAFTATARRVHGHQGYDNLTFRILGLDNIWAIGAGRTGKVAGQTNLFPGGNIQEKRNSDVTGRLIASEFLPHGSGYAIGEGSCLGVREHRRFFAAHYDGKSGAEALFLVADSSANGKQWRLNTPEFNQVELLQDGFKITAPNGASLRARVFQENVSFKADTGRVPYGGKVSPRNPGIRYHGKQYAYNKWISVRCNPHIVVAMTLQKAGRKHPEMKWRPRYKVLEVNNQRYFIR